MIVNKGKQETIDILYAKTFQLAIGTGSNPAWMDNISLQSEYLREDASKSKITTTLADDTIRFEHTFDIADAVTIREYGLFHKDTGNMICRWLGGAIETQVGFRLKVVLDLQVV